jgi:carbon storage regulator
MLVLTRKLMERLFIGDDICVTVVRLEAGQVRLGIEAPREVAVVRAELVPERDAATSRPNHLGRPSHAGGEVKHSPYGARGNGSRHRGRSR